MTGMVKSTSLFIPVDRGTFLMAMALSIKESGREEFLATNLSPEGCCRDGGEDVQTGHVFDSRLA
jgi:hypothetical protein